jgi:hypothetical protein
MDGAAAVPAIAFNEPVIETEPSFMKSPDPPPDGVVQLSKPAPFVVSIWPLVPAVAGSVIVHAPPTGLTMLRSEPAFFNVNPFAVATFVEKFPPASRRTIALFVFASVAAFARFAPEATFAAVTAPTVATVGFGYVPERSPPALPDGAVEGVVQERFPDVSDVKTWPPTDATALGSFKT